MNKNNSGSFFKNTALISTFVLLGKALGFVKQAVIAWAFGASSLTDVYFAADGYTAMFGQIMGQSICPTVLTRYVKVEEEKGNEEAKKIIKESFVFFGAIGVIILVLNILLSSQICDLIGISYSESQKEEMKFFLISLCPVVLLTSLSGVCQGYLDANKKFLPAKLCSLFFSISIIVSVIIFRTVLGLKSLLLGFLMGYGLHTLYMLCLVFPKTGIFYGNIFKDQEFCQMLKKFLPLVVGTSIIDFGHLIDRIVASSLETGSVSSLYYGQVISSDLVSAVIVTSIGTVLLTALSKMIANKPSITEITEKLSFIICIVFFITGIITSLYIVEGNDLIKLFFERGSFDSNNTKSVTAIAICYSIGFVFMAVREVLIKAHYAFQDTVTPMINSIIGVVVNMVLSIFLSKIFGACGIAIATSISMICVSIISFVTIKKHIKSYPLNPSSWLNIFKICIAFCVSLLVGKIAFQLISEINLFLRMVINSFVIIIIYVGFTWILKERVTNELIIPRLRIKCHK